MANKKPKQVSLQLRRDSAANWETKNPVLLDGEEILVYTSAGAVRRKIGDGIAHYKELPFDDERINSALTQKQDKIAGTPGQVMGFDSSGNASPQQVLADDVYFLDGDTVEEKLVGKQDKLTGKAGQMVGFDAQGNAKAEDANFLPLTGGAVNGNLTGKYITGTWLQTTAAGDLGRKPPYIAVLDSSGWVYKKTPEEVLTDMGNVPAASVVFDDGQTFQAKYDAGDLTGPAGRDGAAGPAGKDGATGPAGAAGKDATINGVNALTLSASGGLQGTQSGSAYTIDGSGLLPQETTVTLTTAGWSSKAQTVSVPGILKDQTKQTVDVAPADKASRDAWAKANIWCNDPTADGSLTFVCDTVPTAAVNVRIRWQGVKV